MENFPYDPWQKCKTISGLAADLVISALQKEIRRGHEENAATLAYEMLITSEDMENYLWYRLRTISVEDVGFGDTFAPVLIGQLDTMRRLVPTHDGDRYLLAIHAVRYLCKARKDRSSDEMLNCRTEDDFYAEGSKVYPEWEGRDKTYRERILKILESQKKQG